MKDLVVFDCEVYPNYFLVAFKNIKSGKHVSVEIKGKQSSISDEDKKYLLNILFKRTIIGFNSRNYDIPIILYVLQGSTCQEIHRMSDYIIENDSKGWQTINHFELTEYPQITHWDIQEPSPAVGVSLKLYGARLGSKRLQDLPIEPGTVLTKEQMLEIKEYCINGLDTTIDLYNAIEDRMELRKKLSEEYNLDLMSKSDAQIAETVMITVLERRGHPKVYKPKVHPSATFKYHKPDFVEFKTPQMRKILDEIMVKDFPLGKDGKIKTPEGFTKLMQFKIGELGYKAGIGGLHSKEKSVRIIPNDNQILMDKDVASYYPAAILNFDIRPKHVGKDFLTVFRDFRDKRLAAKAIGDMLTSESYKIILNSIFGKFGSKYAKVYSPGHMLKVTLTGQLALLMLIEELVMEGYDVKSANTDGFVTLLDKSRRDEYEQRCSDWEKRTGLTLEGTKYEALYAKDVNNYIAIKEDGVKGKGVYAEAGIKKNKVSPICIDAVKNYLTKGELISTTIKECRDLTRFLNIRKVGGGAQWRGQYLGKVVRWIYSTDGDIMMSVKPNKAGAIAKVSMSDGSRPIMELGEFPDDIDYNKYILMAYDMLEKLGLKEFKI